MRAAPFALVLALLATSGMSACARGTAGSTEYDGVSGDGTDADAAVELDTGLVRAPEGASGEGDSEVARPGSQADGALADAAAARPVEAGLAPDAALSAVDASSPRDAGNSARDAGPKPPVPDAGKPPPVDAGSRCVAGVYTGTFSGEISALLGVIRRDINGTISITVADTGTGDRLRIQAGALSGKDENGNPVTATVNGTINCTSGRLENGELVDGKYVGPDPLTQRTTTTEFSGSLTGTYSFDPPSASGQWEVRDERRIARGGEGEWRITLKR